MLGVAAFVRAPFTHYHGAGDESTLHEKVRGQGLQLALGDLLTCPYCLSPWVATALTAATFLEPDGMRPVHSMLSAASPAEVLHRQSS